MSDKFFGRLSDVCHKLLLKNSTLMFYLQQNRGLNYKIISDYKIGAFPEDLRDLYGKFNLDPIELREKEIIWNAEQSQFKMYPIVIPINDTVGNTIAIGCRTLMSEEKRKQLGMPKYRNSSYKKASYLYGLDKSIDSIRREDIVFVVEGYFDVLSAHQRNFKNVVATCGTIFSERQLIILSRYTSNICLLFDNDAPGQLSAKRVINSLHKFVSDYSINIVCKFTPEGYKDIDEYLRKGGDINLFLQRDNINLRNEEIITLW
jgi:DNA primase